MACATAGAPAPMNSNPHAITAALEMQSAGDDPLDDGLEQDDYTCWTRDVAGLQIGTSQFRLTGLYCAACAGTIEAALGAVPGVLEVHVNASAERAEVRWNPQSTQPSQMVAAVVRAGYGAVPDVAAPARVQRQAEQRSALWRLFVAGFCMMQVMMYAAPAYLAQPGDITPDMQRLLQWASWLLSIPVLLFSAGPFFKGAWRSCLGRRIGMEVPVSLGIVVTFVASTGATLDPGGWFGHEVYFDSMTMFVFFLLAGRTLELRARHRVAATLEGAITRLPSTVQRLDDSGRMQTVPLRSVRAGDRIRVMAGQAFPADGVVLDGTTLADEALLTGESIPVNKQCGDDVTAGSMNVGDPVVIKVLRLGADTRFESIRTLMRQALMQRPALVRQADRWAGPFLWGVLLLAGGAAAAWSFIDPSRAVWVAVSVLIVTCPCALSLAVPSALLSATGALARRGVLLQRIEALEALAQVDHVFLDKTGTLTLDHMEVTSVHLQAVPQAASTDAKTMLSLAAALASHSMHPASRALVAADAIEQQTATAARWSDVTERPGFGLQGVLGEAVFRLGSASWVGVNTTGPSGPGSLWLSRDGIVLARFDLAESLRPDAVEATQRLQHSGMRLSLLSGDTPERVHAVARRLNLDDVLAASSPEDKLAAVARSQAAGHVVAMVGDGLNDAPVLARADVSFAFAQGTALTQSHADAILLGDRLVDVADARDLAVRTMRVVKQNLSWALIYNASCIPLALAGWLPPWAAGLGMALSSLVVVLNALRLNRPTKAVAVLAVAGAMGVGVDARRRPVGAGIF